MTLLLDSAEGARAMAELQSVLIVENDGNLGSLARHALMEQVRNRVHCIATVADMIAYLNGVAYYRDRTEYPLPGVIILNLDLPGVDGFDALAWLRANQTFYRIPIIVTSSEAKMDALHTAVSLGANGWMLKPVDVADFRRLADELKLPVVYRTAADDTTFVYKDSISPVLNAANGCN